MGLGVRLAFLGFALAVSCAQVLDLDDYETQPPAGGSSGADGTVGGGGSAGSGGAGGMGCPDCGAALPPPGGVCPAACNCPAAGVCEIVCDANNDCDGKVLQCPAGFDCDVTCLDFACTDAVLECPEDHLCRMICDGNDACINFEMRCSNAPCLLSCLSSAYSCATATMTCGCNRCGAYCEHDQVEELLPLVNCGQSCECGPCKVGM